ncbi:hypothetical protein YB2330_005402 [Saitoella coloradoensis]
MNFYMEAAKVLKDLDARKGSIKSLTLSNSKLADPKRTYALLLETLKYRDVLNDVIARSKLYELERKLGKEKELVVLLVHDLLCTKKGITTGKGPIKDAVMRNKARLSAEFVKAKVRLGVKDITAFAKKEDVFLPRWVRVNTLLAKLDKVMTKFKETHTQVEKLTDLSPPFADPGRPPFYIDPHVPSLLAFPPATDFSQHPLYVNHTLILQDKASCFPAAILKPPPGEVCIDACAAPGNKTTHLAAVMGGKGTIFAFERDERRYGILSRRTKEAGADKVIETVLGDFTQVKPMDPNYKDVTHILLDPSCSGSGIVNRLDYLLDNKAAATEEEEAEEKAKDDERLASLADFQNTLVQHAMAFPNARRITYSTCSIHAIENEHVVLRILASKVAKQRKWRVAKRAHCLPTWDSRGIPEEAGGDADIAEGVVRCTPGKDGTIGFFVCLFERDDEASTGKKRQAEEKGEYENEDEDDDIEDEAEGADDGAAKPKKKKNKKKKKKKRKTAASADASAALAS